MIVPTRGEILPFLNIPLADAFRRGIFFVPEEFPVKFPVYTGTYRSTQVRKKKMREK